MRCAIVEGMNRARLLRLLLGGGLTVPSLASGRQAFVPLDKPAGGGGVRITVGEAAADM